MENENRPMLDLPLSELEIWLHRLTIIILMITFVIVGVNYTKLPDTIPIHFDFSGQPDSWGPKIVIWVLPIVMGMTIGFLLWLARRPHILNYPAKITPENAAFQYKKARLLLRWLSFIISAMTFYLSWKTIQIALGQFSKLDSWFIWVFTGAILASVIIMFISKKTAQ